MIITALMFLAGTGLFFWLCAIYLSRRPTPRPNCDPQPGKPTIKAPSELPDWHWNKNSNRPGQ